MWVELFGQIYKIYNPVFYNGKVRGQILVDGSYCSITVSASKALVKL